MKGSKKIVSMMMVVSLCAGSLAGSVSAEGKTDEPLEITFVTPLIAHPVWDVAREGFEQAASDFGFTSNYVGPQGIDPAEMSNQIDIALTQRVDGIITMPISPEAMRPAFSRCDEKETPYVFAGAEDSDSNAVAFVGTNEAELGAQGAKEIIKKFDGEPIKAMIMMSTLDASFAMKARDGYLAVLEEEDNFECVLVDFCNSDMQTAMDKYQAAFKAYPEINLVIGVCAEAGPAAVKTIKEMGLQDKISVMGIDDTEETLDMIRNNEMWGTMAQNFYTIGYKSAEIMYQYLAEGKEPEQFNNDSGSMFVSLDNIDTYVDALRQ